MFPLRRFIVLFVSGTLAFAADLASARDLVDHKSGMVFPGRIGLFQREDGIKYDAGGYPMAKYWAGALILLDVFFYKDNPFELEYANCRDYVKVAHPRARLLSDGPSNLHPNGRRARFTFADRFGGGSKVKLQSELIMFPTRDRYVKFRITYPFSHANRAEEEIDSFIRAFAFP
jgi:hypothetical protein